MKIGIDYREAVRKKKAGKGTVVFEVVSEFKKIVEDDEVYLLTDRNFELTDFPSNWHKVVYRLSGFWWHLRVIWDVWFKFDRYLSLTSFFVPWLSFSNKCIVMVHDLVSFHEEYAKKHNWKAKMVEKISLKGALNNSRSVIVPSLSTKDDLIKRFGVDTNKIKLVYEGVNRYQGRLNVEQIKEKFNIDSEYILFVGTLEPRKNLSKLVEAYAQLMLDINWSGKLVLAGKKGWYFTDLLNIVKDYGLENKVVFTDYVTDEEKFSLIKGTSCFYFVSKYEGFGLPILEAMQMGVPVLTANVSSMPEVAGKAAVMVDPESKSQIAGALREIVTNKIFRDELIQKGLRRVDDFSWNKAAEVIYEILLN